MKISQETEDLQETADGSRFAGVEDDENDAKCYLEYVLYWRYRVTSSVG